MAFIWIDDICINSKYIRKIVYPSDDAPLPCIVKVYLDDGEVIEKDIGEMDPIDFIYTFLRSGEPGQYETIVKLAAIDQDDIRKGYKPFKHVQIDD